MDDAPERRESRKKRRRRDPSHQRQSTASQGCEEPAEEHSGACRDSEDAGQLKPLQGISALVRMFGMSWLSKEVTDKLHAFPQETTVMVTPSCWAHVDSFKTAFLKVRGRDNAAWNCNLRDSLSQIKQVRSRFADEFEPLSAGAAWHCLWLWVHECVFNDDQLKLPNKKKRSILNSILMKELGCAHRVRAVVQRGMQDFDKSRSPSDTLDAFLAFVTHIETTAEASKDDGSRKQFKHRCRPPSRDAEERATIPSYPSGSVARTMCVRPITPPRKVRDKRRHLEDEGGDHDHTHPQQERAVHDGDTTPWLQPRDERSPSRDAEERVTIPSYPAGADARTMRLRPRTPPRRLRNKRRHLEDEGGEPNPTQRRQERTVHQSDTPLWLQLGDQLSSITPSRKPVESPTEDIQPEAREKDGRGIYVSDESFESCIESDHTDVRDEDDNASDIDGHDVEERSTPRPRKMHFATAQHIVRESPVETDKEEACTDDASEGTEKAYIDDLDDEEVLAPTRRLRACGRPALERPALPRPGSIGRSTARPRVSAPSVTSPPYRC